MSDMDRTFRMKQYDPATHEVMPKGEAEKLREIVKAVAHIGVDWGYGVFQLSQEHIDKARRLYEKEAADES